MSDELSRADGFRWDETGSSSRGYLCPMLDGILAIAAGLIIWAIGTALLIGSLTHGGFEQNGLLVIAGAVAVLAGGVVGRAGVVHLRK